MPLLFLQCGKEAAGGGVEAAVGHEHDVVAGAHQYAQGGDERVDVGDCATLAAQRGDDAAGIPGQLRAMQENHRVGEVQRRRQTGRESCRERVCQYVSSSVVAGSVKKKLQASI